MRGAFITFEGGDGAGKSTQARILAQRLRASGRQVVLTREPGGSPFAERVRDALLTPAGAALSPTEQALIFGAARLHHVENVIAPALAAGQWVVSDRFADSTAAYQGTAGASAEVLRALERLVAHDAWPDLTVILDLPAAAALQRHSGRRALDAFESAGEGVHEARRAAFREIAERNRDRCVLIEGSGDQDAQAEAVWKAVCERLMAPASA